MIDKKTKIIISVIIAGLIVLFIGNKIYNDNDYLSLVLVCDYNTIYTNYEETLEFSYVSDTLYEYRRFERMKATEKTPIKDIKKLFNDQYESVKENFSDYFNYEVKETDTYVEATTYIKTLFNEEFYNSYIKEKEIDMESTLEEVQEKLKSDYTCRTEKRG